MTRIREFERKQNENPPAEATEQRQANNPNKPKSSAPSDQLHAASLGTTFRRNNQDHVILAQCHCCPHDAVRQIDI